MKNHLKHFIKYGAIILATVGVFSAVSIYMIKLILSQTPKLMI